MGLFTKMQQQCVRPSAITYLALIGACDRGQQWAVALSLFNKMQTSVLQPTVVTYNALIRACEKGLPWGQTLELLRQIRIQNVQADTITFGALASSCLKGYEWEQVLNLLVDMNWQSLECDAAVYNATAATCSRAQQWTKALQIIVNMQSFKFYPSLAAWDALLSNSMQLGGRGGIKAAFNSGQLRRSLQQQLLEDIVAQGSVHEDPVGSASMLLGRDIDRNPLVSLFLRHVQAPTVAALRQLQHVCEAAGGRAVQTQLAAVDGLGATPTRSSLLHCGCQGGVDGQRHGFNRSSRACMRKQ